MNEEAKMFYRMAIDALDLSESMSSTVEYVAMMTAIRQEISNRIADAVVQLAADASPVDDDGVTYDDILGWFVNGQHERGLTEFNRLPKQDQIEFLNIAEEYEPGLARKITLLGSAK